jgi:hypothetical protein
VSKRDNALDIDIDYLRQRLRYEPETGKLYWLHYESMPKGWLTKYAGKEAFTAGNGKDYRRGSLDSTQFLAHRVAWALHYGEWPTDQIDHINGVKDDNRVVNLRAVNSQENSKNSKKSSKNTSGVSGVCWHRRYRKWLVGIKLDYKRKHLGYFDTIEEATKARKEAEVKYGFHENHGRD